MTAYVMKEIEKVRFERLEAKRMLLKQLRQSGGSWSDGQKVHRGELLQKLRYDTLMEIMALKQKDPQKRKGPAMHRACRNLKSLHRYRLNKSSATIGRKQDEHTIKWLKRVITDFSLSVDTASQDRILTMRRLLRRADRDTWSNLPEALRCSHQDLAFKFKKRRHHAWELRKEAKLGKGITLPIGMEVYPAIGGFYSSALGEGQIIQANIVRRSSPDEGPSRVSEAELVEGMAM